MHLQQTTDTVLFFVYNYTDGNIIGSRYKVSVDSTRADSVVEMGSNIYFVGGYLTTDFIGIYFPSNSSFSTIYTYANGLLMTPLGNFGSGPR